MYPVHTKSHALKAIFSSKSLENLSIFIILDANILLVLSEFLIKASLLGVSIKHVEIPTIYNDSESSMNYFPDLIKFISLWFKSFLWT